MHCAYNTALSIYINIHNTHLWQSVVALLHYQRISTQRLHWSDGILSIYSIHCTTTTLWSNFRLFIFGKCTECIYILENWICSRSFALLSSTFSLVHIVIATLDLSTLLPMFVPYVFAKERNEKKKKRPKCRNKYNKSLQWCTIWHFFQFLFLSFSLFDLFTPSKMTHIFVHSIMLFQETETSTNAYIQWICE